MSKTETKSTVLLKHHLKALKLPTMLAECEKIAQRCANDNADHLSFLLQLVELELIERERKAAERRLKAARFPMAKLLDEFEFVRRARRQARLRPAQRQQAARGGIDAGGVPRSPGEHPVGWSLRHWEDTPGHGAGDVGLCSGA